MLKLKLFIYNLIFVKLKFWFFDYFKILIKSKIINKNKIPIIIINFNQLHYLEKLINFLQIRKFKNIIIIDNNSTYQPLLEYYKRLKNVKVEMMDKNYGHRVFFENKELQEKYGRGFYVLTDADIVPNQDLPVDFINVMIKILIKEFHNVNKVGFALNIKDIPSSYVLKEKVLNWEKQFWEIKFSENPLAYKAIIDTTFAVYKPLYPSKYGNHNFYQAIRMAGNFTAEHGGWYVDYNNLTEEQKYYFENCSDSSSWKSDKNGNILGILKNVY